jgi:RsiW-degrading membrane proteinase PrsW (M82 family)
VVQIAPGSQEHYLVAASGALPAIVAMLYFDWLDRKRPEPWRLRYATTVVGMASVLPVLALDLLIDQGLGAHAPTGTGYVHAAYLSFGLAAGVEEACKIAVLFIVVWSSRHFDERMDGIVYGARAGLGFALVENVLYLHDAATTPQLALVWSLRALLAVPGHALWTGMLGYCAARAKLDRAGPGLLVGYLAAVAMHGTYDFAIFAGVPLRAAGHGETAGLLLAVPVLLTLLGWKLMRAMAHTALTLDDAEAARA